MGTLNNNTSSAAADENRLSMWSIPPTGRQREPYLHAAENNRVRVQARFLTARLRTSAASGGRHSGMRASGQVIEERGADGVVDVGERGGPNTRERVARRAHAAVA